MADEAAQLRHLSRKIEFPLRPGRDIERSRGRERASRTRRKGGESIDDPTILRPRTRRGRGGRRKRRIRREGTRLAGRTSAKDLETGRKVEGGKIDRVRAGIVESKFVVKKRETMASIRRRNR